MAPVAIALVFTVQTGCIGTGRSEPPRSASVVVNKAHHSKDSPSVTLTVGARAELKKLSTAGKNSWQITYNGTCSGAPALGMYEVYADIPNNATIEKIRKLGCIDERAGTRLALGK